MWKPAQAIGKAAAFACALVASVAVCGPVRAAEPAEAESAEAKPAEAEPPAAAAPKAEEVNRFEDDYLFGNWGGLRSRLWERGIDARLLLITDPYGNPVGGEGLGFSTYSMLSGDVYVDTNKAMQLPGGMVHVGFSVNFGTQLSQDIVGNTFPIQSSDVAPPGPRLTTLSYTQSLFDDVVSVRLGRLSIDSLYGEEFAGSSYFRSFTSVAFNAIPFAIFYNSPGAFGYPATTWGARLKVEPRPDFYAMAGIYNGDPDVALADRYGIDFSLRGPAFAIAELGWRHSNSPAGMSLPGNVKVGAFVLGGAVQEYGSTTLSAGRHGFYGVADQVLSRFGEPDSGRSLGIFGSVVIAPDASVSPMPHYFNAGLVAYGPFATRPRDLLALGVAYGAYSGPLRRSQQLLQLVDSTVQPQVDELTIELSYGIQLFNGVMLQPGVQVLVNPGGSPATPAALALGLNAVLSF
jgi:porin